MTRATQVLTALVVFSLSQTRGPLTAAESARSDSRKIRSQAIRFLEFEDITPAEGLLLKRARYTYEMYKGYMPEHVLTLNYSTKPSDKVFPLASPLAAAR